MILLFQTTTLIIALLAVLTSSQGCTRGDVRLSGVNATEYEGRVEICMNGEWGIVCDNYWDSRDARVVCRQLGHESVTAIGLLRHYDRGETPSHLDYVECIGNETSLIDCQTPCEECMPDFPICEYEAGVTCYPQGSECVDTEIRLSGGSDNREGRIEVCFHGYWGSVCGSHYNWSTHEYHPTFTDAAAHVTCRQLGYVSGRAVFDSRRFGSGTGPIHLDNVECNGTETSLADCPHSDINVYGHCFHFADARVSCFECQENDTRLVGGSSQTNGRVEICVNGEWGTICHNYWDTLDAQVVCRQLGFESTTAIGLLDYGGGVGEIILNYVNCSGEELSLRECPVCEVCNNLDTRVCTHIHDAGVDCFPQSTNCTDGDIRLADGAGNRDGRIEVCFGGYWGAVCRWHFDWVTHRNELVFFEADARVACRQLGYPQSEPVLTMGNIGPGTGPIFLGNLQCNGSESRLADCPHTGINNYGECTHLLEVTLICSECLENSIRLQRIDGSSLSDGRVEVCRNGEWGTICHNSWDARDARVVCRQLGYETTDAALGIMAAGVRGEEPAGPIIHLNYVSCFGTESSLSGCRASLNTSRCGNAFDVGVICNPQGDECVNGSVRLVGGSSQRDGRVEVCYLGYWGTVCGWTYDNSDLIHRHYVQIFNDESASVVCRQLNYVSGEVLMLNSELSKDPTNSTKPILLNGAQCNGDETNLFDCPNSLRINEYDGCLHATDVTVICHDCIEDEVRLVNGSSPTDGRVEICRNGTWSSLCHDYWDTLEATVICQQLGYNTTTAIGVVKYDSEDGVSQTSSYHSDVNCTGSELRITQCPPCEACNSSDVSSCKYAYGVEVNCFPQGDECQSGEVRLVNGRSNMEGTVEICSSGLWGSVCGWHFDVVIQEYVKVFTDSEASVVCRQLGFDFERAAVAEIGQFGPQSSGPIFLDNVRCNGSETRIADCSHSGVNVYSTCGSNSNAGVFCTVTVNYLPIVWSVIIGLFLVIFCLVVFIFLPYYCHIKKQLKREKAEAHTRQLLDELIDNSRKYLKVKETSALLHDSKEYLSNGINSDIMHMASEFMDRDELEELHIPFTDLKLLEKLGQGEFGIVHKAQFHKPVVAPRSPSEMKMRTSFISSGSRSQTGSLLNKEPPTVAVKTLDGYFDEEDVRDLMKEVKKMQHFNHPHVLNVVGLCLDAAPAPYIVMPFMANGSLQSYLRKERRSLVVDSDADEDIIFALTKRLTDMCLQIAKGMEYLANMKIIHRDLAARNCMIDGEWIIKVADFGLSESTAAKDYFRQVKDTSTKLPVKWMAIESLHDNIFSEKSDVWSFGVTCWEVFNGGKTPYPGMNPLMVIEMLDNEERLARPNNKSCNDTMYSLMLQCWLTDSRDRPTFTELVHNLIKHLESLSDYMNVNTFQSTTNNLKDSDSTSHSTGNLLPFVIKNDEYSDYYSD